MKKFIVHLVFAALIASNGFSQEQVDKPTHQHGDFWQFKSIRKRATGTSYSGSMPDGTYMYILRQVKGNIRARQILENGEEAQGGGGLGLTVLLGTFQDQALAQDNLSDTWLTT